VLWHGIDKSIPTSGTDGRVLFYSPRLGLAYDVWGSGSTVVRGGWGMYRAYDSLQSNSYVGPAQTAIGAGSMGGINRWSAPTFEDIDKLAVNHPLPAGLPPGLTSVNVVDPKNDNQPVVTSYSFSIDQRLPGKFTLEMSYVGNYTKDIQPQIDINAVPVGAVSQATYLMAVNKLGGYSNGWQTSDGDALRPRTNYQAITSAETGGKAQYDSFQASLKRYMGWLNMQVNYTYGKAFSEVGNYASGGGSAYSDWGAHEYYGVSPDNRTHTMSANYVITLPTFKAGNKLARGAINGWQISGITQVTSGANLFSQDYHLNYSQDALVVNGVTIHQNDNWEKMGTNNLNLFPKIVCNPVVNRKIPGVGTQYLDANCFKPADQGTAGTTNTPYLPGPMYWNSDLALSKNFKLTERQSVSFRIQASNFLNHPLTSFVKGDNNLKVQFNGDGTMKNANTFGIATVKYGQRTLELSARYSF